MEKPQLYPPLGYMFDDGKNIDLTNPKEYREIAVNAFGDSEEAEVAIRNIALDTDMGVLEELLKMGYECDVIQGDSELAKLTQKYNSEE